MARKNILDSIIKNNPQIDLKHIDENEKLHNELKKLGVSERGYKLASPFERKRVQKIDNPFEDSKTLHLHKF